MRVLMILAVSAFLLSGLFFLSWQRNSAPPDLERSSLDVVTKEGNTEIPAAVSGGGNLEQTNSSLAGAADSSFSVSEDPPEVRHKTYVESRVDELMELAMNDDSTSLDTILGELTNRDPQIRKGAVEAAIQFGSRDAIPKMLDAASQTDDPREKAEIADAIEFLKIPSLSEAMAQKRGVPGLGTKPRDQK